MKKIPKEIIALIIAAVLIIILLIVLSTASGGSKSGGEGGEKPVVSAPGETTTEADVADVEPIELPDKSEAEQLLGFEPNQVEKLSDKYVLRLFQIEEGSVVYYYQQHLAANGRRLQLKITKMTPEEYQAALPGESVRESVDLEGREAVLANRTLFKVGKDYELTDDSVERKMEKEGTALVEVVEYGKELVPIQTLDWYENGCRYEIYTEYLALEKDEITELALYYINNGE